MDPTPLPPHPTPTPTPTPTTTAVATNPTNLHLNYPDSMESSPRSQAADTFNEPLPLVPGAKLRLMCSYGGHIIPRPHDKSLCYVGGETRMVVIDRNSSLPSLCSRLARTLLNGRPFTLKYQLPNEDLDSLVSVTTDEDLENMIEEYDRITSSSSALSPSRIRLFLFFTKPETVASMGSLLDDAKSETWFVDALNGSGLFPRNLSDSATMDCLVSLDNDHDHVHDLEAQTEVTDTEEGENKQVKNGLILHDAHIMPDSPVVENGSSFGFSSSSPSMCNLPPIRVRVEDQNRIGVDEQFARMTFAQVVQKQDDGNGVFSATPPLPPTAGNVGSINPAGGSSEHLNRVLSDDERSDQGVPVNFRKPPLPLQPQQTLQQKTSNCYNLPSPDSVASDSSIASASSLSKPIYYQDQSQVAPRAPASPDTNEVSVPTSQIQIQQVQDSGYAVPSQLNQQQQQQFVHATTHFIPHPATTPVPMPSYYPVYAPPSQSQQAHHPVDHQYPVYVMTQQQQPYMSMQPNMVDATIPSRPPTPPMPTITTAYKDSHPPIYPTNTTAAAISAKPEMTASAYRTAMTGNPQLVQVPASQYQQQYVGYSQVQHPSQSIAVASAASASYGYEYPHDQVYYAQHQAAAAPLPPQYQTMSTATAVALADASKQLPPTNNMQQIGTTQPL